MLSTVILLYKWTRGFMQSPFAVRLATKLGRKTEKRNMKRGRKKVAHLPRWH